MIRDFLIQDKTGHLLNSAYIHHVTAVLKSQDARGNISSRDILPIRAYTLSNTADSCSLSLFATVHSRCHMKYDVE